MNLWLRWKYLLACIAVIFLAFAAVSVFDVVVAVLNARFYTNAAFIVIFGVGGIFAGVFAYYGAIQLAQEKNEFARWSVIITIILSGLLFFFPLSEMEGGEYEVPFKAFGITLALSSLLFMKGKVG